MAGFFLGVLLAGLVGGTVAYNCYTKREAVERSLRTNIKNLEHNLSIVKKETAVKVEQLNNEIKKAKDNNNKAINDIDMLNKDINSLHTQLADCKKKLEVLD
ncbi:MAG: hypothetical protein GY950_06840 [bacterium]|nr:hypothetical protein [bacterium]